jgi:hypothetical protein
MNSANFGFILHNKPDVRTGPQCRMRIAILNAQVHPVCPVMLPLTRIIAFLT